MTHTVTIKRRTIESDAVVVYADIDITAYVTDGITLTAASFGLHSVNWDEVMCQCKESATIVQYRIDVANKKLLAYTATNTQATQTDIGVVGVRVTGNP